MTPANRARRRVLRALLTALASSGLTAAGIGGPLAGAALGETNTTPASESGGSQGTETGTTSTNAETTPSETTTQTTTPTTTAPTATAPTPTTPATTTAPTQTTGSGTSAPAPSDAQGPTVVLKRKQQASSSEPASPGPTTTTTTGATKGAKSKKRGEKASGPNNVAVSPQVVAAEAGALAAVLASSEASVQSLSFYRIPLFLLPIYKAAAVQYGVPWQILAAINEIETDYGSDLSVSSAGAVGWMQFMPSTWLQYGVDALDAGNADPYNPVDAVFAAARYLRAAGAATNLRAAILAYNHSEEYVESVLLRAKLISTYPKAVIATLTGLVDGRLPVTGRHVAWETVRIVAPTPANATAGASAVASAPTAAGNAPSAAETTPGSTPAVAPTVAAAAATTKGARGSKASGPTLQLVDLTSAAHASVVAVQDGTIVKLGDSRKLGRYIVLRDVYGDVFTYAGLGQLAKSYVLPKPSNPSTSSPVIEAASTHDAAPSQPATAGSQSPLTLQVKAPAPQTPSTKGHASVQSSAPEGTPPGMDRVRLFAHPGNPDARAAAVASAARKAKSTSVGGRAPLRTGAVVASGTVLGTVSMPPRAHDGHLRFAVQPAGDAETVDPGPILANWAQLQGVLHPKGAKATNPLLGATASDAFLLSKPALERAVLSDPGITIDTCGRHEVASGKVDKRVLAVLAFLSRSGLEPTVTALPCSQHQFGPGSALSGEYPGGQLEISAINGTKIAGHQGPETITDLTIRALLTLPAGFAPHEINSLMRYPGSPSTHAAPAYRSRIELVFNPPTATPALNAAATATQAHSARTGRTAPSPIVTTSALSSAQWDQLMLRVAALPMPTISSKPSSAAIPDPSPKRP
jgi:hypothetical protein